MLRSALDIKEFERERDNELILVTSDRRLEIAAKTEGLRTIKPESVQIHDVAVDVFCCVRARPEMANYENVRAFLAVAASQQEDWHQ